MEQLRTFIREDDGQGTVEYAILVGMLVVIGIVAIMFVSGQMKPIWEDIQKQFGLVSPAG